MSEVSRDQAWSAIASAAELLGPLAERDRPIGELTTYRVGGPAALFSEPATVADLERLAAAVSATGIAVLVLGRGRTYSSPMAASPACVCGSPTASPGSSSRPMSSGRAARPPIRFWRDEPPPPVSRDWSGRSGYRDRSEARSG